MKKGKQIAITLFSASLLLASTELIKAESLIQEEVTVKPIISVEEVAKEEPIEKPKIIEEKPKTETITISAIGDCTLGSDPNFGYSKSFYQVYDENGPAYFFDGVSSILSNDDLTIANLETTFTSTTSRLEKSFNFKGPAEYTEILKQGSVEVVNIANNHSHDYKEVGFQDTINNLENASIPYFGYLTCSIQEVRGIKIGLFGCYNNHNLYGDIDKNIEFLKQNNVDIIIGSFHFGKERDYKQNKTQQDLARYAIDHGCDLVLGHHPHVIQGIEEYKGKYIVYSLANFVFGGNKNPKDKDTFIFRENFTFEDKQLIATDIEIIPTSVSSLSNWNDFQPTVLERKEKERVLNKILKYSNISYEQS